MKIIGKNPFSDYLLAGTVRSEFAAEARASEGLTPERARQIRQNILLGKYDLKPVLRHVARRVLGSGDLATA